MAIECYAIAYVELAQSLNGHVRLHRGMSEKTTPSIALLVLTTLPPLLLIAVWFLTGGFSENPSLPPFYSKILPLVLIVTAALVAFFAYNLARDEEPEWERLEQRLIFKTLEGAALAYIAISAIFAALQLLTYFLR